MTDHTAPMADFTAAGERLAREASARLRRVQELEAELVEFTALHDRIVADLRTQVAALTEQRDIALADAGMDREGARIVRAALRRVEALCDVRCGAPYCGPCHEAIVKVRAAAQLDQPADICGLACLGQTPTADISDGGTDDHR